MQSELPKCTISLNLKGVRHREAYLSEPDLTTAERKAWNSGFPPGFTVDELRHYRRRRAPGNGPRDHLRVEEGNFDQIKSEYRRRYKKYDLDSKEVSPSRGEKPTDDAFWLEEAKTVQPEYAESFVEYPIELVTGSRRRKRSAYQLLDDIDMALYEEGLRSACHPISEVQSQFLPYERPERALSLRRSTTLKLEGDFGATKTEQAEEFVAYLIGKRRDLIRNSTNLRLEGRMEGSSETREQYKALAYQPRPPLCKKFTNLHLEGEMGRFATESNEQFVDRSLDKRPPLIKHGTNLKLEGAMEHKPEYRQAYSELKGAKATALKPQDNLHLDGYATPPTTLELKLAGAETHSNIPDLRGADFNKKSTFDLFPAHPDHRRSVVEGRRRRTRSHPSNLMDYEDEYVESRRSPRSWRRSQERYSPMDRYGDYDDSETNESAGPTFQLRGDYDVCHPQYRKAFADYLIRERIERKPRPLENPGVRPMRAISLPKQKKVSETSRSPKVSVTPPPSAKKPFKSQIPISTSKLPYTSSTDSEKPPKSRPKPPRRKSIGRLETKLFGPKVAPTASRSRTPSPYPPRYRSPAPNNSDDEIVHRQNRTGHTYRSKVTVEDLAYTPLSTPIPTRVLLSPAKSRENSFMVLPDDINNNSFGFALKSSVCNQQKWMPSWCGAP